MSEAAKTEVMAAPPGAASHKPSKMIVVLVALNLAAVSAVGAYLVFMQRHAGAPAPAAAGAAVAHEPEHHERGPIVPMDPIVTNMAGGEGDRYLKVTVQLEATNEGSRGDVERDIVPIRDRLLVYISGLQLEDTQGVEKKRHLQAEMAHLANEVTGGHKVSHIYFTEFVVQ